MIYLVTTDLELPIDNSLTVISVEESIKLLTPLSIIGLDTETSGLSIHSDKLLSVQLGCKEFQVVIDCNTIDITQYKSLLESDRLFIGWNLKFDLKWFFTKGIILKKVWDGFLMEKLLWNGYPLILSPEEWSKINNPRYTYVPKDLNNKNTKDSYRLFNNLKWAGKYYLGVELDKSVRGQIIWKGLVKETIIYAATDVKYLKEIREKQIELLTQKDLMRAAEYENRFVIPLAYCEYCGVKIDRSKWLAKMAKDQSNLDSIKKDLDNWLIKNLPDSEYICVDRQGNLFSGFNTEPQITLNWNSTQQVLPIFKKFGVDTSKLDKDSNENKDSTDAKVLGPQKDKCSLIPIYLKYKEAVKVTSTYGNNILSQLDENDRLYTNFNQCGADTFRLSSGGKDGKIKYINLQNLPADAETRACFVSEEGNKFISIDYKGEESVIMASIANDKAMINELMYGEKDLHTLTAKLIFPYIPKDMPADEVKEKYHDERSRAKGYEFLLNYMGNANTMVQNYGISLTTAQEIENAYMKGFSGLKKYQDESRKDWLRQGYILINPITGHKAYIYDYPVLKEDKKWMSELDWDYYREMKRDYPSCDTVQRVRNFFRRKADSDKQSGNYKIQGTGAIIFRAATILFWDKILKNDWFNKVKLCIPVHDEWDIEAPEEIAEEVTETLYQCMVKAGSFFSTNCKLDADISRLEDGSLPTYWIH